MIRRLRTIILIGVMPLMSACHTSPGAIKSCSAPLGRAPHIDPDYAGITIPPNIAPLNFRITEPCRSFMAEFSSKNGEPVRVAGQGSSVRIPPGRWRKLLEANKGEPLHIALFLQDSSGRWLAANPIQDTIAAAPIDRFVTYRVLSFLYNHATDLEEHERDLESFHERVLLNAVNYTGCCNCHTPLKNDPGSFVLQSRSEVYGSTTLICRNGTITPITSRLGYTSWHPSGQFIAFSVYKVEQCFHAVGGNFIEAYDKEASIVIYDTKSKSIEPVPALADARFLQTWPCWSPDGRSLYFCAAPVLWSDATASPPENYDKVKYSLCRIGYDASDNSWRTVDTVLSSGRTGLSISQPRLSPDGRFVLFCMHDHGGYPHTQKSSDLYMMDLATKQFRRLDEVNSEYSESWHGWSSNGRWILFSSKRDEGLFTRLCFSYVDASGAAHKPFILPQEDPAFYESFVKCFNVPEFATAPVRFDQRDLLRAILSPVKAKAPIPAGTGGAASAPNPHFQ